MIVAGSGFVVDSCGRFHVGYCLLEVEGCWASFDDCDDDENRYALGSFVRNYYYSPVDPGVRSGLYFVRGNLGRMFVRLCD